MALLDPIYALPKPQKIILGVLPLVVVGALGYFMLISPKTDERDSLFQRNEALRAEVIKARADEASLRPFRLQAEALRKRLEAAKERLPVEKEIPRLYRQISDLAFQSGLGLALFQPKPPEERAVFAEVPITMTTEAGYHQLGAFFDRMARLPRVVTLGDFKATAIDRPTGTVRAEMTLATYVFRAEGAPAPGKPGAPAAARPAAPGGPVAPRPGTRP
jgi:type IV pilus assembly protein PilO